MFSVQHGTFNIHEIQKNVRKPFGYVADRICNICNSVSRTGLQLRLYSSWSKLNFVEVVDFSEQCYVVGVLGFQSISGSCSRLATVFHDQENKTSQNCSVCVSDSSRFVSTDVHCKLGLQILHDWSLWAAISCSWGHTSTTIFSVLGLVSNKGWVFRPTSKLFIIFVT